MAQRTQILSEQQIEQKINRIAFQILENNINESVLCLVGIQGEGNVLADKIHKALNKISSISLEQFKLTLDKTNPLEKTIVLSPNTSLEGKAVVLIDDVVNSGKALMHSATHLLKFNPKNMHTAVLVDRIHRRFPIRADYVGLALSTTLQEHISVEFSRSGAKAFLD